MRGSTAALLLSVGSRLHRQWLCSRHTVRLPRSLTTKNLALILWFSHTAGQFSVVRSRAIDFAKTADSYFR